MNLFSPAARSPRPAPLRRGLGQWGRRLLAAAVVGIASAQPAAAAYLLAPQYSGSFGAGTGVDAEFHRIQNGWTGSAVLWDEDAKRFGSGVRVGTISWGTGLWGQVDWLAVQQAAAGESSAASGSLVQSFRGLLPTINHANSRYLECYSTTWGPADLVPLLTPARPLGDCDNAEAGDPAQQNWTARYSGFLRITDPGEYNFSVLHDDGFFFRLIGEGGTEIGIGRDLLNPRDRVGFSENLRLAEGLYGFELGAWNRVGAGVVDLRWASGCENGCNWSVVPTGNLVSAAQVSEPPAAALALIALLGLWLARSRRLLAPRQRLRCSLPDA